MKDPYSKQIPFSELEAKLKKGTERKALQVIFDSSNSHPDHATVTLKIAFVDESGEFSTHNNRMCLYDGYFGNKNDYRGIQVEFNYLNQYGHDSFTLDSRMIFGKLNFEELAKLSKSLTSVNKKIENLKCKLQYAGEPRPQTITEEIIVVAKALGIRSYYIYDTKTSNYGAMAYSHKMSGFEAELEKVGKHIIQATKETA